MGTITVLAIEIHRLTVAEEIGKKMDVQLEWKMGNEIEDGF